MGQLSVSLWGKINQIKLLSIYMWVKHGLFPFLLHALEMCYRTKCPPPSFWKKNISKQNSILYTLPPTRGSPGPEVIPEAVEQMQSVGLCVCVCVCVRVCLCVEVHAFLYVHACESQKSVCNLGISFFRSCLPCFSIWCKMDGMCVSCMWCMCLCTCGCLHLCTCVQRPEEDVG